MELKKRSIKAYEPVLEDSITAEHSADMIVPDLFPDIAGIVNTSGQACIKEKNLRDGKLEVSGLVRVGVLYKPELSDDEATTLRKMDVNIPFTHTFEAPPEQAKNCVHGSSCVRILSAESRAVNPRKIQVSVIICIEGQLYKQVEITYCDEASGGFEVLKSTFNAYILTALRDKTISVTEEMDVPGSKPAVDEILKADVHFTGTDVKTIGNKAVYKGNALLRLLCMGKNKPFSIEQEFPISQIIEMDGLEDGANVELKLQLSGIELDLRGAMGSEVRSIGVTIHVDIAACAYVDKHIDAVSDLYVVGKCVKPDHTPVTLNTLCERNSKRHNVRESIDVGSEVSNIVDTSVYMWPINVSEGGASVDCTIKVVYCNDAGEYLDATRKINIPCPHEAVPMCRITPVVGEVTVSTSSDGLEVRFTVDFDMQQMCSAKAYMVTGFTEDECYILPERPSLTLRRCHTGESLWDMAKRYGTTRRELALVNALESIDIIPQGKLMLIPTKK